MHLRKLKLFLALFTVVSVTTWCQAQTVSSDVTQDTTWTAGQDIFLDGLVFVNSGATLTIDAGAVIKGLEQSSITTGDGASALIVRRGAAIMAEGTAANPIIFTSELDDLSDPADLDPTNPDDRGLWGGVIILGNATTNQPTTDNQIEGIPSNLDALYGGNDDGDDSGVFRYVSIRHGGFSISGVAGDEINGLTMGAVGDQTTIEFVEVLGNFDDGYEWFGGTVNAKWLVAAFCGDDAFDYDQGFRGKGQFWFAIQSEDEAGRGGEHDGGDDDETGTPFSTPEIWNATYIGSGAGLDPPPAGDGNNHALIFRDNAGGMYSNSIFTGYTGDGVNIEDIDIADSRARLEAGDLQLRNNIWFDFGAGIRLDEIIPQEFVRNSSNFSGNVIKDPGIRHISRTADGGLDPRPHPMGPASSVTGPPPSDGFFMAADYEGAFDPASSFADLWVNGWTGLSQTGFLGEAVGETITLTDDFSGHNTLYWMNEYMLDGLVFVEDAARITIQGGTVIKGLEQSSISSGDGASALIVRRGGQIVADGTAKTPVIFTSELDDLTDPGDLDPANPDDRGLWGGLILLGNATTNQPTTDNQIEGVPATEDALYGGNDDNDNSGVLRYVSIRHGGFSISGVAGDEINGLTMGGVGDRTTIEHIEVFGNFDDGYEWFGGTVHTKYLAAAFCGDDAFDYDQGFRGKGQFWFAIQLANEAGRGGEHDGGDDDETGTPFSIPEIWNATYIGSGSEASPAGDGNNHALIFRDNAGGMYSNSIFTDFTGDGVNIEDIDIADSRERLQAGDLQLRDNIWWEFGAGSTLEAIIPQDFVRNSPNFAGNQIVDPQLRGISRTMNEGLDPRPSVSGPAGTVSTLPPNDGFFDQANYRGAFDPNATIWTEGWTALDQTLITTTVEERIVDDADVPREFALSQNYPNPFNPSTSINYSVVTSSHIRLTVYNLIGQRVATLVDGVRQAGEYTVNWDATLLGSGVYVYRLETGDRVLSRRMMLLK